MNGTLQFKRGRILCAAAMLSLGFAFAAVAQEYSFRLYGKTEGLKNLVVLSLAQDRDGYIWAGTEGGLYRYDGTRFRLAGAAEGLPCSTETHGLFTAADGALWANICSGVFRFDGKRFQAISGVSMMLRGAQVMADGANGSVLIATPNGLVEASRSADGSYTMHSYSLPPELAGKPIHSIFRQGAQTWFGCDQALCMAESVRVSVFGPKDGLPQDRWDGIRITHDGSVWVRSATRLYYRAPGQTRFSQPKPDMPASGFWGALELGRDGTIMVPTDQGLAIHTPEGWNIVNRQRGLRNDMAAAVVEDRSGSLWLGLVGGGVARWLGRGQWDSWRVAQGLPSDLVWSIRRDKKGALWVGTSMGLTRIDSSGRSKTWARKDGLGGNNVRRLAETPYGIIWAAMRPGGLARIDSASGKIRLIGKTDGLLCNPDDVFADRSNRLWVPTACGIFRNDHPSASNSFVRVDAPESLDRGAWKVLEDGNGIFWVTNRDGLWSLRNGQWRRYGKADGLLSDNPYVMALAADGSIWLRHRYDAGVERVEFSGDRIVRTTAIVPADPKSTDVTAFHGFDSLGNFWRGTADGVDVRHGDIWTKFTIEDGLVWNDCDGEAFWADADGSVWIGTSGGLSHYQPGNGGPQGPLVADPIISRLEVNQRPRLVRAEFSSLDFKAEQLLRFAYRLDDAPWTESNERTISIGGLGPGRHRLELRCAVRNNPFSQEAAIADFQIEPLWRETWWARLLALAGLLVALSQFVRWRLRTATRRREELEAVVSARTENLNQANSDLQASESRFRSLFDSSPDAVFLTNPDGTILIANSAACAMLGWTEQEICKVGRLGVLDPADPHFRPALEERMRMGFIQGKELTAVRKNGERFPVEIDSAILPDKPDQSFVIMRDITERKAREEQLLILKFSIDHAPNCAYWLDTKGQFIYVNEAGCRELGYSRGEILQMHVSDVNKRVTSERWAWLWEELRSKGSVRLESEHCRKDGTVFPVEISSAYFQYGDKEYCNGFAWDITERKAAEQALSESEVRFRTLIERSPVAIGVGRDSVNLYANNAYLKMFGFEHLDEIVGQPISSHWSHEWRQLIAERSHQRSQGLQAPSEYDAIAQRKDGSQFPAHIVATAMDLPGGRTTVGFVTDLSGQKRAEEERTKLERQLQQAQKMESVGRLAGGVAHDFNNMLGVILGHAEMLLEMVDASQPIHDDLEEILKAGRRSADLTRQLLAFARKQTVVLKVLNLNATIEGMLKMLERMIGENILLSWQPAADLWPILMDPSQVDQILANLCVNARDAIRDTGRITIETGNCILDENFCATHEGCIPGNYVRLAVRDDGCGMERETLGKIFEPFFTTKEAGVGTGLGLSMVYGAIKQNSGFIYVDSEYELGTTITIYLPRHRDKADAGQQRMEMMRPPRSGQETILLVEDEPAILRLTARILQRHGYTVLEAIGPGEAIRMAREHAGEIHMLMTDVIMPEMNGRDLAKSLLSLYPLLKRLFMSGYTADVIAHHGVLDEGVGFIQKPFSAQSLANKVKEVLDSE
jgi:two-component system cell cycle sensor histidine kinase/response regulator CckA